MTFFEIFGTQGWPHCCSAEDVDELTVLAWFQLKFVLSGDEYSAMLSGGELGRLEGLLCLRVDVVRIFLYVPSIAKKHMQALCVMHGIRFNRSSSNPDLARAISGHRCSAHCLSSVFVFRQRSKSVAVPNAMSVLPAELACEWRSLPCYHFDERDSSFLRTGTADVLDSSLSVDSLARSFDFVSVHPVANVAISVPSKYRVSSLIAITGLSSLNLIKLFPLTKTQLHSLYWVNGILCSDPTNKSLSELKDTLLSSASSSVIRDFVYIFSVRRSPREPVPVINSLPDSTVPGESTFPWFAPDDLKLRIIDEVQAHLNPSSWVARACASCGRKVFEGSYQLVDPSSFDLALLRNDMIPEHLMPSEYNLGAYRGALLCCHGLMSRETSGPLILCSPCHRSLVTGNRQPLDAWANFQYYAHAKLPPNVLEAFQTASLYELQLVSGCRSSNITHSYAEKMQDRGSNSHLPPQAQQRFSLGNVAITPQDYFEVRRLLPPDPESEENALCVIFLGAKQVPTQENVRKLHPVMVSKRRVHTMIDHLLNRNPVYKDARIFYSPRNLDAYVGSDDSAVTEGTFLPSNIRIFAVPAVSAASDGALSDYTDRARSFPGLEEHDVSRLLMPTVGFTRGDHGPQAYHEMKADALKWCLSGRPFLQSASGDALLNDQDHRMLTFLFPHLDPWGIGGFNHPDRRPEQKLSFERQLKNLVSQYEGPFERDPNFAYVCWNILQKREVSNSMRFKVDSRLLARTLSDLDAYKDVLPGMLDKWKADPHLKPTNDTERKMILLINRLKVIVKDLRGSAGAQLRKRNEVRALQKEFGCQALFFTLTPSDIFNVLVHVLSGKDPDTFASMTALERAIQVAENPAACARFFDISVKAFIRYVLRYGDGEPGLFGHVDAYYGSVEAQGRGTLHCHFLVWLRGYSSPQDLRNFMGSDDRYKAEVLRWVESLIKCELPGDTEVVQCAEDGTVERPVVDISTTDPRCEHGPYRADYPNKADWNAVYEETVRSLAILCNWHTHTSTCWKYLKGNQEKTDASCRMRMDGSTRATSSVDPETLSILLRRLHPKISNYNDLALFLFKCNVDIKFVGSGEAAKALVYYVTDYVTKQALPTYLGLDAVSAALTAYEKKMAESGAKSHSNANPDDRDRALMVKIANSLLGRQEVSHQQVMSYLVGSGDFYCSHTFATLHWGNLNKYVQDLEMAGHSGALDCGDRETVEEVPSLVNTVLSSSNGVVFPTDAVADYVFRSHTFDGMNVWDYCARTERLTATQEERRLAAREHLAQSGRDASDRVKFCSETHPLYSTHLTRLRRSPQIVVPLGPTFPRADREEEERNGWCRTMLILFKPWRELEDLCLPGCTWSDAFQTTAFDEHSLRVMKNLGLEHECKDARDRYRQQRLAGSIIHDLISGNVVDDVSEETDQRSFEQAVLSDEQLDCNEWGELSLEITSTDLSHIGDRNLQAALQSLKDAGVFAERDSEDRVLTDGSGVHAEFDRDSLRSQLKLMRKLKSNRRPMISDESTQNDDPGDGSRRSNPGSPRVQFGELQRGSNPSACSSYPSNAANPLMVENWEASLAETIDRFGMRENQEQMQALMTIGKHFCQNSGQQLMMYVGGVGGTGKSHLINSIVHFFKESGFAEMLLLGAPTGIAAVLINGWTLHALCYLSARDIKAKLEDLRAIWKDVRYLIIDEVSMLSAKMLAKISEHLSLAKSADLLTYGKPFGGINIIFMGDFGQLKPVQAKCLYDRELVSGLHDVGHTANKQGPLLGVLSWRLVDKVVFLKKNMRQAGDKEYADLVQRVRIGKGTGNSSAHAIPGSTTDYKVLCGRLLKNIRAASPDELRNFDNAPVIVAERNLRDHINVRRTFTDARRLGVACHIYAAQHRRNKKDVSEDIQRRLCKYNPPAAEGGHTNRDLIGELPLFPGLKVMITENVAINFKVVNGAEGWVESIAYTVNTADQRVLECVYVKIPGCGQIAPECDVDVVPIFPSATSFDYAVSGSRTFRVQRLQVPLLPAYAYTDYKSQGRSLEYAIVDLAACRSLQSVYVMLSRVKSLQGLAILRPFPDTKIRLNMSGEVRAEFDRLERIAETTRQDYNRQMTVDSSAMKEKRPREEEPTDNEFPPPRRRRIDSSHRADFGLGGFTLSEGGSGAFDVAFTCLIRAYEVSGDQDRLTWMASSAMAHAVGSAFQSLLCAESSQQNLQQVFDETRDSMRQVLISSSEIALSEAGGRLVDMGSLLHALVGVYDLPLVRELHCEQGCVGSFPGDRLHYSSVCSASDWKEYCSLYAPSEIDARFADAEAWLRVLASYRCVQSSGEIDEAISSHSTRCTGNVRLIERHARTPFVIALETAVYISPRILPSLMINVNGPAGLAVQYRLSSMVYVNPDGRYTARLLGVDGVYTYGSTHTPAPVREAPLPAPGDFQFDFWTLGEASLVYLIYAR